MTLTEEDWAAIGNMFATAPTPRLSESAESCTIADLVAAHDDLLKQTRILRRVEMHPSDVELLVASEYKAAPDAIPPELPGLVAVVHGVPVVAKDDVPRGTPRFVYSD
jgi:hypothetical protein